MKPLRSLRACAIIAAAAAVFGACGPPPPDLQYRHTETLLEILSELSLHIRDDTYRFPPAADITGKNIYRATLIRLENYERIYEAELASAYLNSVIIFSKARAFERLGEYKEAARLYSHFKPLESPLREEAINSRKICLRIAEAVVRPIEGETHEDTMRLLDAKIASLSELAKEVHGTHYEYIVRGEEEKVDLEKAKYLERTKHQFDSGLAGVVRQYEHILDKHRESKNYNRHILRLAGLFDTVAHEYVTRHDPSDLNFDILRFNEYADTATRLYESVANQDGIPEKLEASSKLAAFVAFAFRVRNQNLYR